MAVTLVTEVVCERLRRFGTAFRMLDPGDIDAISGRPFMTLDFPIVVFSHLRWDFVYQRPQQLLSRLATRHRILYMEEPVEGWRTGRLDADSAGRRTPGSAPRIATAAGEKRAGRRDDRDSSAVSWPPRGWRIQSPGCTRPWQHRSSMPLIPSLVVYDCMDELSLFLGAPPEMVRNARRSFSPGPTWSSRAA